MATIHTVFDAGAWRNKVDGLQQGTTFDNRACAVSAGSLIADELGGAHVVHDIDGRVAEITTHEGRPAASRLGPLSYTT